MKDMQRMMKEAQKMAAQLEKAQAALAEMEFEGRAGGGAVTVVASGDLEIQRVTIDTGLFEGAPDEDDIEMLSDAVTAAVNDALGKVRDAQQEFLGPMAGGLGLPGM